MTAAHCTDGSSAGDIEVLLGEHNYDTEDETTALRMSISEIVQHEDYDPSTTDVDFSLLKLEYPIDFSAYPHIRPACLPENDDNDYAGYPAIVSGWGTTSSGGDVSSYLQYVDVNILSNAECSSNDYGYGASITEQMMCANVQGGGKDACQGDSGGPLVSPNPDLYELIGVVSWGVGCALADFPGVYARMSKQLSWVADITGDSWNTCGRCDGEECSAPAPAPAPAPGPLPGAGSDTCTCGQSNRATKIVGGEETLVSEFPWQVGLVSAGYGTSVWCGATLISDQWIMTAAHCTDGSSAGDIEVLLGEHNYDTEDETTALRMSISEIVQHEDYDPSTTDVDFSLLKLEYPIDFSAYPHIRPACLPENDDNDYAGYPAIVSGWGTTSSGGDVSSYLQYVDVNILSNAECSSNDYGYGASITEQMMCANVQGGGKDACQGDSGGPLVSPNPDLYELIGVVSWGVGCAEADFPGVYARMSKQLAWVAEMTEGSWNTCGRCVGEECTAVTGAPAPAPAPSPTSAPSTCDAYPDGHTMNIYPGPSDTCASSSLFNGFTEEGMAVIIAKHNELRQQVASGSETNGPQPAASDMMKVHWNSELASVAQRWADQCTFGHDDDRSKCDGTYVGQNAYSSWSSQEKTQTEVMAEVGDAVQAWYNEVVEFGFNTDDINPFVFNYDSGHYSQVVWAESAEVGCGLSYYDDGGWFANLVICNYAVGGNMQGGTMYTEGAGCSNCPAGTSCDPDYPALCA